MLKLGSLCIDPLTGVKGFVSRFILDQPIGRAPDGTEFKAAPTSLGRTGPKKWEVRVIDDCEVLSEWLPAKKMPTGEFKILGEDKIWAGLIVRKEHLEIREAVT